VQQLQASFFSFQGRFSLWTAPPSKIKRCNLEIWQFPVQCGSLCLKALFSDVLVATLTILFDKHLKVPLILVTWLKF
jgi:hypothetical protein